jgi:hypothetical protein
MCAKFGCVKVAVFDWGTAVLVWNSIQFLGKSSLTITAKSLGSLLMFPLNRTDPLQYHLSDQQLLVCCSMNKQHRIERGTVWFIEVLVVSSAAATKAIEYVYSVPYLTCNNHPNSTTNNPINYPTKNSIKMHKWAATIKGVA